MVKMMVDYSNEWLKTYDGWLVVNELRLPNWLLLRDNNQQGLGCIQQGT